MKQYQRELIFWCGILLLFAVIASVGIDDPAADQARYCKNVKEGIWPDYEGTYKAECGGEDPPKFNADLTK